jgi:hypothetical protein
MAVVHPDHLPAFKMALKKAKNLSQNKKDARLLKKSPPSSLVQALALHS